MPAVKVGVLLDAAVQERWVLESLQRVLQVPGVTLDPVAILLGSDPNSRYRRRRQLAILGERGVHLTHRLMSKVDVVAALEGSAISVAVESDGTAWHLPPGGVDAVVGERDVDMWLCFTQTMPEQPAALRSRFGVWRLEIGRGVPAASDWAGASEVVDGSAVTMTRVVDYAAPTERVLYCSFGATARDSAALNRRKALQKGIQFFARLVEGVAQQGALPPSPITLEEPHSHRPQPMPTLASAARLAARTIAVRIRKRIPSIRASRQWQIAYYFADEADERRRFDTLRYLVPPRDRFWADPIAVERQGRYYIFFEELPYRTQRGRLAVVEVFEDAEPAEPQLVLERDYHLSYPFVFAWDGINYMLPETAANKRIEIYRSTVFPQHWELHTTFFEGVEAFDATLWNDGSRWWMFVNIAADADACDELHLYSSASPMGPWVPHRRNPIVSDVRCARPAGPLYSQGGRTYRPSQDDSVEYGRAVVINRVDIMNDDEYRETVVDRIFPDWRANISRIHTLGRHKRLNVVDCMVRRPRW